jgi:hypothetical protein
MKRAIMCFSVLSSTHANLKNWCDATHPTNFDRSAWRTPVTANAAVVSKGSHHGIAVVGFCRIETILQHATTTIPRDEDTDSTCCHCTRVLTGQGPFR